MAPAEILTGRPVGFDTAVCLDTRRLKERVEQSWQVEMQMQFSQVLNAKQIKATHLRSIKMLICIKIQVFANTFIRFRVPHF